MLTPTIRRNHSAISSIRKSKCGSNRDLVEQLINRISHLDHSSSVVDNSVFANIFSADLSCRGIGISSGWQAPWSSRVDGVLGGRLFAWNNIHFDASRLHTIVTSRRDSGDKHDDVWRQRLDVALLEVQRQRGVLLTDLDTPDGPYIEHRARRLEISLLRMKLPRASWSVKDWLRCFVSEGIENRSNQSTLWISPPVGELLQDSDGRSGGSRTPSKLIDLCNVFLPRSIYCVGLRSGGNLERVLFDRLQNTSDEPSNYPTGTIRIPMDAGCDRNQLLDAGAIGWWIPKTARNPYQKLANIRSFFPPATSPETTATLAPILPAKPWIANQRRLGWSFLTHCTRASQGPWPDESLSQHWDALLLPSGELESHPLVTLLRILKMDRLVGTQHLKRCEQDSISFSATPLDELLSGRSYQKHLHRWDWEPYGICIGRSELERLGARPVTYGSQVDFERLAPKDHPFFQFEGNNQRWRHEREWRLLDSLRLHRLPSNSIYLFVPTLAEARCLAQISRYPILVLDTCL